MKVNPVNSVNTKALPIADIKVKGVDSSYKLFSVNFHDRDFLEKMYKAIDLKKLMPGLYDYDYMVWDEILHNAVNFSKSAFSRSILGVCDNKPCGILNYKEYGVNYHLNYIATFPAEPEKRVPCAGQILFNEFFNRFIHSNKRKIELCAVKNSPFSPIAIYKKLGFSMDGGDGYNEDMSITRDRALKTLEKQSKFLTYTQSENSKKVDLDGMLNLDFMT